MRVDETGLGTVVATCYLMVVLELKSVLSHCWETGL
jgi:hypothetical protein